MESPNTRNDRRFTRFVSAPDFVVRPRVCRLNSAPEHGFPEPNTTNSPFAFSSRLSSDQTVTPLDSPPAREPAPDFVFPSTTFLHIYDRPSVLPKKDPSEAERHRRECERIIMQIKKKLYTREARFLPQSTEELPTLSISDILFSEGIVRRELVALNESKSPGSDEIPPKLHKEFDNGLSVLLNVI
ncbi:hypothetical protein SprV_0200910900 [Sparganum proliferum]